MLLYKSTYEHMRRIIGFLLCLVMAMTLMMPITVHAQESGKTVRVGWYESPFNTTDQFGRRSGYAYDYQQKIAAYTGWDYEYVEGSWPELMQMLSNGEIDLMSDVSYTEERAETMLFSSLPMGAEEYYIFISPDNKEINKDDLTTFNGKKVGINKGSVQVGFFREWAEANDVEAEIIEMTEDVDESLDMLNRGDIDMYVVLDGYLDTSRAVPVCKVGASDFFFAVNKSRPDLQKDLNSAMDRIQEEDRSYNQQLYDKYLKASGFNYYLSTDEKDWLAGHGAIRVGYQDNNLAFCAEDKENGELTGALKDYLENASSCFNNAELSFEPVAYPTAAAAIEALKKGEIDCMFPSNLSASDGEAMDLLMTPSMMTSEIYAIVRKADKNSFFQKEQITAAVVEGDPNYEAIMADHFSGWKREGYPEIQDCLKAVADGKADCVLISNYQYNNLSRRCDRLKLTSLTTGENADFYIAVPETSLELYSILTRTTDIVSHASINAALSYYSAEDAKTTLIDFVRDNPAIDIAAILVILALLTVIIMQQRMIRAEHEVEESQHQVEDLSKRVFVDALTSVRNKGGFDEYIQSLQDRLDNEEQLEFAVVMLDCDDLKKINDQYGHDKGDIYIRKASQLICNVFKRSPVFRTGGDEFVVLLQGEDYRNREELLYEFDKRSMEINDKAANLWEKVNISKGMAVYRPDEDAHAGSVLHKADTLMYQEKKKRKSKETVISDEHRSEDELMTEDIPVINARKRILIAEDIEIQREMLGDLLQDDYDILFASDGVETLGVLRSNIGEIDLVLLDLYMPNMNGREVIKEMQVDEELMSVPVIVLTMDQDAELDSLKIGAMDFIPKPYPDIEIIKARINKCIELSEDRDLIRHTERDKLTGLLNKDYFFRYVGRLDHIYKDTSLDAIACDVNDLHSLNKKHGRLFGDHLLRSIGISIRKLARKTGGIGCRYEGDTFLLYCPHQDDYEEIEKEFVNEVLAGIEAADKVGLRFGIYTDAQLEPDIEERFVRAKIAADRVIDDKHEIKAFEDKKVVSRNC